jgi:hypothetical protein
MTKNTERDHHLGIFLILVQDEGNGTFGWFGFPGRRSKTDYPSFFTRRMNPQAGISIFSGIENDQAI